jgi:hypothetical protein
MNKHRTVPAVTVAYKVAVDDHHAATKTAHIGKVCMCTPSVAAALPAI